MLDVTPPIAVMDATCALCSLGARMIHRLDRSGEIRICPIQSASGRAMLIAEGLDPDDPDSWLFVKCGRGWHGFEARIRVGERSGGFRYVLSVMRLLPMPSIRWLYARIARNRDVVFGRGDISVVPDPGLRARLLE